MMMSGRWRGRSHTGHRAGGWLHWWTRTRTVLCSWYSDSAWTERWSDLTRASTGHCPTGHHWSMVGYLLMTIPVSHWWNWHHWSGRRSSGNICTVVTAQLLLSSAPHPEAWDCITVISTKLFIVVSVECLIVQGLGADMSNIVWRVSYFVTRSYSWNKKLSEMSQSAVL